MSVLLALWRLTYSLLGVAGLYLVGVATLCEAVVVIRWLIHVVGPSLWLLP